MVDKGMPKPEISDVLPQFVDAHATFIVEGNHFTTDATVELLQNPNDASGTKCQTRYINYRRLDAVAPTLKSGEYWVRVTQASGESNSNIPIYLAGVLEPVS